MMIDEEEYVRNHANPLAIVITTTYSISIYLRFPDQTCCPLCYSGVDLVMEIVLELLAEHPRDDIKPCILHREQRQSLM